MPGSASPPLRAYGAACSIVEPHRFMLRDWVMPGSASPPLRAYGAACSIVEPHRFMLRDWVMPGPASPPLRAYGAACSIVKPYRFMLRDWVMPGSASPPQSACGPACSIVELHRFVLRDQVMPGSASPARRACGPARPASPCAPAPAGRACRWVSARPPPPPATCARRTQNQPDRLDHSSVRHPCPAPMLATHACGRSHDLTCGRRSLALACLPTSAAELFHSFGVSSSSQTLSRADTANVLCDSMRMQAACPQGLCPGQCLAQERACFAACCCASRSLMASR